MTGAWAIFAKANPIGRQRSRGAVWIALAFLLLTPLRPSLAMTAEEAFADGNRLFRDDLYWAALLRYRQATDAGMDSPLLHYNTGVAHYRAGQHIRAREALRRAAESPALEVLAHYNLGLNAYAAGDNDEALRWFRRARDQQQNAKIRELASRAIARLEAEEVRTVAAVAREQPAQETRKLANLEMHARVGFGNDDNVYRSPTEAYIDFANPNLPLVTPAVSSGAYIPVDFRARYSINSLIFESFFGAYSLSGKYFQDKDLDNANEFSHEIRFGSEYDRREGTRRRQVYSAFSIAQHDETYYDPDDGSVRAVNGAPIENRMNYLRYGPEIAYRESFARLSFGLRLKGQLWNYDETMIVPEFDHEYFVFRGNVQYRFTSTSLLRVNVGKYSRRFGDRPSYDLDGAQRIANPTVRYDYLEASLTARQRIADSMWFGVSYERTDRTDRHAGYNNYSRDDYGLDFHWSPGSRFDLEVSGYYRIYDFPNAFAFNNPVAGRKTLETTRGRLLGSYRMTPSLSIVVEADFRGADSTDSRIAYDRNQYSIGVRWER
jgi:tetratricopeptide (TPR) repeat protein